MLNFLSARALRHQPLLKPLKRGILDGIQLSFWELIYHRKMLISTHFLGCEMEYK